MKQRKKKVWYEWRVANVGFLTEAEAKKYIKKFNRDFPIAGFALRLKAIKVKVEEV